MAGLYCQARALVQPICPAVAAGRSLQGAPALPARGGGLTAAQTAGALARPPGVPPGPQAILWRTLCITRVLERSRKCLRLRAQSCILPCIGPPIGSEGSYPQGAWGPCLRGFLHLPSPTIGADDACSRVLCEAMHLATRLKPMTTRIYF